MLYTDSLNIFYRQCLIKMLSDRTIENYKYYLLEFNKYLKRNGIEQVENIRPQTIEDFFVYKKSSCSPCTLKYYFIAMSACFKCLVLHDIIPVSPMDKMSRPRVPKKIIQSFSKEEIQEILTMYDKSSFIGLRNYTIICLLFSAGIRRTELLQLRLVDVNIEIGLLTILGKGNKSRNIPLSPVLKKVLKVYLKKREEYLRQFRLFDSNYLIISKQGKAFTVSGLGNIFHKMKQEKRQWTTRVSAHTFRHTFAKFFLLNGGDVFSLQKLLGHEDLESTRIYVDLTEQEVKVQNERFNPLDNTKWQYY